MIKKDLLLFLVYLSIGFSVQAASSMMFRISFTDKRGTMGSLEHPENFLSMKSLERRQKQQLMLDSTDLPVSQVYIKEVLCRGARLVTMSKWNNTIVVEVKSDMPVEKLQRLPFVSAVKKVWTSSDIAPVYDADRKKKVQGKGKRQKSSYGVGLAQLAIHKGECLHKADYRGEGIEIAVIDAGFQNVDAIGVFKKMHLKGTRDFVNPHSDIFAEHNHGTKVLSCMAANEPHVMVGSAPEASYWLLRSEDDYTEQPVEEDYWVAAAEYADSLGVDIVNTSLGYYEFDDPEANYTYRELDGHTSPMSVAASLMAGKGMVLVCSAGNSGKESWKKITPPADAVNILSVGAVNVDGINADFSSIGNTADNRIKPDIMSVGFNASVVSENGIPSYAHGTSFAAPVFCGLVACLWQACPWLTAMQLIKLIQQSADRADFPDNIFGYGVPDVWKCYQEAIKLKK